MCKILVIDDRRGNLTSVKATLESAIPDCLVINALSGKEGIRMANQEQPDVILLDVVMPEMDGYEVCKRLKTNSQTRHIHVILISAYETDTKNKVMGFSAGADAFLIRPIEGIELAAQVSSMLRISRTEQQLKEALKKAEESDRLKTSFLATMSHEFRTPLNAIIGYSALLEKTSTPEEIVQYGKTINDNGYILLRLVEDLFDMTLLETGEIRIRTENIHLMSLLRDLEEIASNERTHARKEHLEIRITPPNAEGNPVLQSDPVRIRQILGHLIKNAVKFTGAGSVEIGFRQDSWTGKRFITFFVKDTGIGIARENHMLIFEQFRQVDETYSRPFQGAGIGLFIAKQMTGLLGGELWVESALGVGSTFFLTLPLVSQSGERGIERSEIEDSKRQVSG